MVLAVVLAAFVFVVGPTVLILNLVPGAIGSYFSDLAQMAARTEASGGDAMAEWMRGWTVFYWAWWISWTPFVGVFIARIRPRPHHPPVRHRRPAGAERGHPDVVRHLRWGRHRRAAGRRGRRRASTSEGQLFGVLSSTRWPP